jgi:hypothetical protein
MRDPESAGPSIGSTMPTTRLMTPGLRQALTIPTESAARKALPLCTGVLDYFPDALLEVAHTSKVGNDQHNPGQPLHWAKEKSTDDADALVRHLLERGTRDTDGVRHSAKVAWRALALLQREIDAERQPIRTTTVSGPGTLERAGIGKDQT